MPVRSSGIISGTWGGGGEAGGHGVTKYVKHPAKAAATRTAGTTSRRLIISSPSAPSRPAGASFLLGPIDTQILELFGPLEQTAFAAGFFVRVSRTVAK